jgi:hypothetical protein
MKSVKILSLAFIMAVSFANKVQGQADGNNGNHYGQIKNGNNGHNGNVAAPLDGGLLTILGAAGVAYFTARKKGNNQES